MEHRPTDHSPVIEIRELRKIYKSGDEDTVALGGINLTIMPGEFVAIMGPSGSGKSSLMHILGLLDVPTSGSYSLAGEDVSQLKASRQAAIRNHEIGFVFQQFNLLPRTRVIENLLLPTVYGKLDNATAKAEQLLEEVGLENRAKNLSNQLSGGQIQRVAIARALMMDPSLLLTDEPTGNLDSKRSAEIMRLFQSINRKGATIVLITHEDDVAAFAKRIIRLKDGQIISDKQKVSA